MIILTVQPTDNIQTYLDILEQNGGGILNLNPTDTFHISQDINLLSNFTLNGNGATIDFDGGAYGVKMVGSDSYNTGTISATFGSSTITGAGTVWTSDMTGQSILIGDFWYEIANVGSSTSLTLAEDYIGLNVAGESYVIASTVYNTKLQNITLQNSATNLVDFDFADGLIMDGVSTYDGLGGIQGSNSANVQWVNSSIDNCETGLAFSNVPFCTINNIGVTNITSGTGIDLNKVTNTSMGIMSIQGVNGVGLKYTNCSNFGFINYSIINCASHGIEYVSGNSDMDLSSGYINSCGGDGIRLAATSSRLEINTTNSQNNTGYGFNVANASCNGIIFLGNSTLNNTAGALNDIGTGTLKSALVNNFI